MNTSLAYLKLKLSQKVEEPDCQTCLLSYWKTKVTHKQLITSPKCKHKLTNMSDFRKPRLTTPRKIAMMDIMMSSLRKTPNIISCVKLMV